VAMSAPVADTSMGTKHLPRIWPWILVMVIGVVMVPTGIAVYVAKTVSPLISHQTSDTPTTISMQLGTGTYYVYEDTMGGFAQALQPDNVSVSPSSALAHPPYELTSVDILGANGTSYQGEVAFDVVRAGDFRIVVRSPGEPASPGPPVSVFVAPSLGTTLTRNLGWFGLSAVGGLLFILGLILLIVRGVQRSRRRAPPQFEPRCANGHPAHPQDRFCHACGAPVYAAAPTMAPR